MCEILLQFKITALYFNIFYNVIYSCDGKAEFPVSNDSAEIILIWCSSNISHYYHIKQLCCLIVL